MGQEGEKNMNEKFHRTPDGSSTSSSAYISRASVSMLCNLSEDSKNIPEGWVLRLEFIQTRVLCKFQAFKDINQLTAL